MKYDMYEEKVILQQVAEGSQKSFRLLFDKYHQRLGSYIFNITKSQELAEEVVQDVFLKIWLSRDKLLQVHSFQAYLYTISKNHTLNCLKKIAYERNATITLDDIILNSLTEDAVEDSLQYALMDEAIDQLPYQQRQVYLLSRHERLEYSQIASRLNISRETVKKYLQLATASIQSYVRKHITIRSLVAFLCFFSK